MRNLEARVLELVRQGVTENKIIARRLRCDLSTVSAYRCRHGCQNVRGRALHLQRAQQYGFPDVHAALRVWTEQGLTNAEMGDRLGCWAAQVSIYINHEMSGIVRPPGRGRRCRQF